MKGKGRGGRRTKGKGMKGRGELGGREERECEGREGEAPNSNLVQAFYNGRNTWNCALVSNVI